MLLDEKDRQKLLVIFNSIKVPVEIWAYGSRINGTAHEGSDLDLALRTETLEPMPIEAFMDVLDKIQDSTIPILVELRDWARLPESFHGQINKRHELLFSNCGGIRSSPTT